MVYPSYYILVLTGVIWQDRDALNTLGRSGYEIVGGPYTINGVTQVILRIEIVTD